MPLLNLPHLTSSQRPWWTYRLCPPNASAHRKIQLQSAAILHYFVGLQPLSIPANGNPSSSSFSTFSIGNLSVPCHCKDGSPLTTCGDDERMRKIPAPANDYRGKLTNCGYDARSSFSVGRNCNNFCRRPSTENEVRPSNPPSISPNLPLSLTTFQRNREADTTPKATSALSACASLGLGGCISP